MFPVGLVRFSIGSLFVSWLERKGMATSDLGVEWEKKAGISLQQTFNRRTLPVPTTMIAMSQSPDLQFYPLQGGKEEVAQDKGGTRRLRDPLLLRQLSPTFSYPIFTPHPPVLTLLTLGYRDFPYFPFSSPFKLEIFLELISFL